MSYRVTSERAHERSSVVASGELDAFAAPDLRVALHAEREASALVCDLSGATFLDSTALGVIVGAFRRAREAGTMFHVVLPAGPARRIFELTALDQVLPLSGPGLSEPGSRTGTS